jgi:four helix bundle protein
MSKSTTTTIKDKTFNFAVRVVKLSKYLQETHKEFVISKQILKSGTSIGANTREAYNGESDADFIHKLSIAQKEASETIYWIELLHACAYLETKLFESLHSDICELYKIITSCILTKKKNMKTAKQSNN